MLAAISFLRSMIGRIASRGNVKRMCNSILLEFVREPRVKRRRRLLIERYHGPLAAAIGREIDLARIKRKPFAIDVGRDTQARLPLTGTQPVRLVVVIPPLELAAAADVAVVFRAATPLGTDLHSSLPLLARMAANGRDDGRVPMRFEPLC